MNLRHEKARTELSAATLNFRIIASLPVNPFITFNSSLQIGSYTELKTMGEKDFREEGKKNAKERLKRQ